MKKSSLFIAALAYALVICGDLYGQMIGGSSFLKGNYLEIGIAPNGSLGGGPPVPGGYHPAGSLNSIGAMYDWGRDGWTTGTPPSFGEFTMLGSPFEGWSVQANGVRYDAYYTMGLGTGSSFSSGLSGSNTSWSNAGGVMTNVWQGSAGGLVIRQRSTIETGDSWMTTTVSLVNTTGSPIPGVYFWRSVDSDGDPASPINYNTVNRIVYQNDAKNRSLVVAEGVTYRDARMGYGAVDPRAKVMIYENWAPYPANTPGNSLDRVYNQTTTGLGFTSYNVGATVPLVQDIAIGIIFNLGTIASSDSAVFRYITTFGDTTTIDSLRGATSICVGGSVTLSGPTSPFAAWTSSNTAIATVSNTGIVTGISVGNVVVTLSVPTMPFFLFDVVVEAAPSSITAPTNFCAGFTPTLTSTPSGGIWTSSNTSSGTVSQAGVLHGVNGGVTVISYSNSCGVSSRTVTINKRPTNIYGATVVAIAAKVYLCPGGITTLSNDGYPTGAWSSGNSAVATVNSITGVLSSSGLTGTTSVTAMNICGGSYVDLVVAAPTAISGNLVLCSPLMTTTLSNGAKPGTWTSGNTSLATIEPTTGIVHVVPGGGTGTVPIRYTFAGGCFRDTTLIVTASPGSITGGSTVCIGVPLALSNATGGGTWTSASTAVATVSTTTGIVTGVAAGTAVLTYATACGVTTTTVTVGAAGYIDAGAVTVCAGSTIALSNATSGGSWSTVNTGLATVTAGGALTGVAAGTTAVTYTLSSCAMYITTVTVLPAPNVGAITGIGWVCVGSVTWLSDTVAGGVWGSSNTLKAVVGSDGSVTGIDTGVVTISYTIVGACGAVSATKTVMVDDIIDPGVIVGPDHVCEGATITLSNTVQFGSWSSGNSAASVSTTGIVTGVDAGVAVISYSIISNSCGVTVATATVTVDPAPDAGTISGPDSLCPGAIIQLNETVTGGAWSSGNVAVASILNMSTGRVHALTYGVTRISYTVSGGAGCTGVATFTLAVTPPPFTINALVTDVRCYGDKNGSVSVSISGNAPVYQFLWSTGASTSSISGLDSGFYILNVNEPQAQCIADTAFRISQPAAIVISDSATADLCNTSTGAVILDVSGGMPGYSYLWSTQQMTKDINNLHAGIYSVTVTDMNSCARQYTAVVADSACKDIIIHDVITPNGDGFNDVWVVEGITGYKQNSVQIFDKWGDKVYDKGNYQNDWNGTGKSGLLPDGTYYYLVKLNAPAAGGGANTFSGSLLIKR